MCAKTEERGGEGGETVSIIWDVVVDYTTRPLSCTNHQLALKLTPFMIEFVSRHCHRDPIFHLICDSKFGPRSGSDPQSLSNRVNAGVIERFESFRLRDLERGSKWLPDESSSQFGRKPQVTKLMTIYQSLSTLGGFSDRTADRICLRWSSRAECEIRARYRSLEQNKSVWSLITIKMMTDVDAFIMPKSRSERLCGVECCWDILSVTSEHSFGH